jgi:hypothetical protein
VVENQVDVAALREGVIVSILAEPNTRVRKGQLLARRRPPDFRRPRRCRRQNPLHPGQPENWEAGDESARIRSEPCAKALGSGGLHQGDPEHAQYKVEADKFEISRETEL